MARLILKTILLLIMFTAVSSAKTMELILKSDFGPDLTHAPFFLRFSFMQEYNKDWGKSDYSERKEFLTKYETTLQATKVQEKADAQAAAAEAKEQLKEKKEKEQRDKEIKKAWLAEEKAEKDAELARQKAFNDDLEAQKKELQDLQHAAAQSRLQSNPND